MVDFKSKEGRRKVKKGNRKLLRKKAGKKRFGGRSFAQDLEGACKFESIRVCKQLKSKGGSEAARASAKAAHTFVSALLLSSSSQNGRQSVKLLGTAVSCMA